MGRRALSPHESGLRHCRNLRGAESPGHRGTQPYQARRLECPALPTDRASSVATGNAARLMRVIASCVSSKHAHQSGHRSADASLPYRAHCDLRRRSIATCISGAIADNLARPWDTRANQHLRSRSEPSGVLALSPSMNPEFCIHRWHNPFSVGEEEERAFFSPSPLGKRGFLALAGRCPMSAR
jgi:hypothetical protein